MDPICRITLFVLSLSSIFFLFSESAATVPLNCSDLSRLCTSFLAFKTDPSTNVSLIQSMFDVLPNDITMDSSLSPAGDGSSRYLFVKKNCSCMAPIRKYLTNTTFTVLEVSPSVSIGEMVDQAYAGLAYVQNSTRRARIGTVVSLHLLCGCSSSVWNYLMSYVMKEGDTVEALASRFGVSMADIESVNGMDDPTVVDVGRLYYIPLNSVPGVPYAEAQLITPAPAPSNLQVSVSDKNNDNHMTHIPLGWILGGIGVGLLLILAVLLLFVWHRQSISSSLSQGKDVDGKSPHKFQILKSPSFCYSSGAFICCTSGKPSGGDCIRGHWSSTSKPKDTIPDVFQVEKPIVFKYDEVLASTEGFSDSNLLGHGTYGSVYYGVLRDQEVAIKKMMVTKTREFTAEMKVLCKVHHANLVELIGYAASEDELFLIHEYAHKGSLRSHLHDPHSKGNTSLSWISRVQIAVDAARGLEYIHEHAKAHYVHRDIKSSNILLDNSFRAKISDFGLAKLVEKTSDADASTTRVVGTFGYLAPEYLRDGRATTKSDVYAFGVVLFELISGKEAITRGSSVSSTSIERRSLASVMLAALKNSPNSMSMTSLRGCIDPSLMDLFPHDCVYKMAALSKQCVDEDPILRPDMKQVGISLSQIHLSSVEWEATLAGNSQVFSGLVHGR